MQKVSEIAKILIVDDDIALLRAWKRFFKDFNVYTAPSLQEGWNVCRKIEPDAVIVDIVLPDGNGLDLIPKINKFNSNIPVIVITGQRDMHIAAQAVKMGAYDFLAKPVEPQKLKVTINRAVESFKVANELAQLRLKSTLETNMGLHNFIFESKVMQEVMNNMLSVAKRNSTVLLLGPSGVGKSSLARILHNMSNRKTKNFVEVNLPTISEGVLESQLFGHVKGAYTGAIKEHKGIFAMGDGGTVFLDEIGDIPQNIQVKLLQVLQDGTFYPVGSNTPVKVDVRIVAATVRDLHKSVQDGNFREDLFYRLSVFPIKVPPLKDRKNEIPFLVHYFLMKYCKREGIPLKKVSSSFINKLMEHDWPGNIRELANAVEYAVTVSKESEILSDKDLFGYYLFKNLSETTEVKQSTKISDHSFNIEFSVLNDNFNLDYYLDNITEKIISYALAKKNGNLSKTADLLGISRRRLGLLLQKLNINISTSKGRPKSKF